MIEGIIDNTILDIIRAGGHAGYTVLIDSHRTRFLTSDTNGLVYENAENEMHVYIKWSHDANAGKNEKHEAFSHAVTG